MINKILLFCLILFVNCSINEDKLVRGEFKELIVKDNKNNFYLLEYGVGAIYYVHKLDNSIDFKGGLK